MDEFRNGLLTVLGGVSTQRSTLAGHLGELWYAILSENGEHVVKEQDLGYLR